MNPILLRAIGHDIELIDPNVKTCYLFNEGTGEVCKDHSQYGNNGTLKNGAKWTLVSEGGNGIEFDGNNDYIEDVTSRHIVREGTSGIWSKVIVGDKTKIVGSGMIFKFQNDANKKLTGQFITDFADYCTNLTWFTCRNNSFSGTLPSFAACTNLTTFRCYTNSFSGTLPSFAACTNLTYFYCHSNSFSGTLPSFAACTSLLNFQCYTNSFSGMLPSFAACTNLINFQGNNNSFSGTLPSFAACVSLNTLECNNNSFSGTLPSFAACVSLKYIAFHNNSFSGTLPSFAACTNLTYFNCRNNSFSGYEASGFATQVSLATLDMRTNAITAAAGINAILADLRTSYDLVGRVACTVKLEGGTNAAPTGQGITDKTFLNDNGWTVTTN